MSSSTMLYYKNDVSHARMSSFYSTSIAIDKLSAVQQLRSPAGGLSLVVRTCGEAMVRGHTESL